MYRANLKRYWREQLIHVAVAAFAGWLLSRDEDPKPGAGATIMGLVAVRQGLEFAKRNDSVGIDLAYHMIGLLLGVATGTGIIRKLKELVLGKAQRQVRRR